MLLGQESRNHRGGLDVEFTRTYKKPALVLFCIFTAIKMFTILAAALAFTSSAVAQNSSFWPNKALYEGLDIFNEGLAALGGASSEILVWPHNTSSKFLIQNAPELKPLAD